MNKMIECICCGRAEEVSGSYISEHAKQLGWAVFFDQRNGLETVWVCDQDLDKVRQATSLLREVFGDRLGTISMVQVAKIEYKNKEASNDR